MPRIIGLIVSLLCLGAALCGQDRTERLEAVADFKRYFKKFKSESDQCEAVLTLEGNECPEAVTELLRLLEHKSAAVRQTALAVLSSYREAETFQPWLETLGSLGDEERATLVKVFGLAGLGAALPAVRAAAADAKASVTLKYEACRALARIGAGAEDAGPTAAVVGPLLADADPLVRLAAVDCVGQQKLRSLGDAMVPLLSDPEWQVRSAAVTAAGIVRPQAAVQPLIDLMRESGRLQIECAEALFRLTGFEFGLDADRWQRQWDALMEVEGWRIPTEEELAKKAASRRKYDELYGRTDGERNTFAGIPTTSTRVLFVIDVSGSMDDLVVEREKFEGYQGDYKKLSIVRQNLLETIDGLTRDTYFDIVAFASDLRVWKRRLVPANIVNRAAARTWIERLEPIGGTEDQELAAAGLALTDLSAGKTNTLKALLYPFGVDPEKPPRKVSFTGAGKASIKNKLDTVYFLSDGRPSVGRLVDTLEILKEVRRHNEVFKIVFHAIAIGEFQKEFLRDLAAQNGGVYVDLGR